MINNRGVGYSGFQVTGMIFGGLKFSIPGFFWVGKFGKYFFGWLDLSSDFLGIQNNLKICGSACVSWPRCHSALLLKQMFLGVLSVVRMTTRCEKDNFR